jgi:hypothetical protein
MIRGGLNAPLLQYNERCSRILEIIDSRFPMLVAKARDYVPVQVIAHPQPSSTFVDAIVFSGRKATSVARPNGFSSRCWGLHHIADPSGP